MGEVKGKGQRSNQGNSLRKLKTKGKEMEIRRERKMKDQCWNSRKKRLGGGECGNYYRNNIRISQKWRKRVWPRQPANCPKLMKTHTFTKAFHGKISDEISWGQKMVTYKGVLSEMAD